MAIWEITNKEPINSVLEPIQPLWLVKPLPLVVQHPVEHQQLGDRGTAHAHQRDHGTRVL